MTPPVTAPSLVYTSCYYVCPSLTLRVRETVKVARGALGNDTFSVVTLGFDTPNDTPERMGAYGRERGVGDTGWYLGSTDAATMARLVRDVGFTYFASPKGFDHITQTTILDGAGRVILQDPPPGTTSRQQPNVRVWLSAGQRAAIVPALTGESDRTAQLRLAEDGLEVAALSEIRSENLPDVAQTLAQAVSLCRQAGREEALNCIACENMMDSSSTLGTHVHSHLSDEDLDYCEASWGFPDCMISRVVPQPGSDPLIILTENYNEWTARAEAFRGSKPSVLAAMELVNNQTARLEQKLFIHDGGHAICGYIGYFRGHKYIHEAVHDPVVVKYVAGALDELGEGVRVKHGFSPTSIDAYKQDLVRRGSVPELKDEIRRVVRDPARKLSARERLIAPALLAEQYGLPREWIVKGIVAALKYHFLVNGPEWDTGGAANQGDVR